MSKLALIAALFSGILGSSLYAQEDHHHHDHGKANPPKLSLNNGKKWQTDAPLRTGMTNIRKLMDTELSNHHGKKLSNEKYESIADQIKKETDSIFKNCKLEAKADANLHLVLAQILAGVNEMKSGKTVTERQMGAHKVAAALGQYGEYFDHPGWKPVSH